VRVLTTCLVLWNVVSPDFKVRANHGCNWVLIKRMDKQTKKKENKKAAFCLGVFISQI
jgi:hypothetical protein